VASGLYLTLLVGPMVALPAPKPIVDALTSVEVTIIATGRSAFQLSFTLSRFAPCWPVTVPVAPLYAPEPPVMRPDDAPVWALTVTRMRSWPCGRPNVTRQWALEAAKSKVHELAV